MFLSYAEQFNKCSLEQQFSRTSLASKIFYGYHAFNRKILKKEKKPFIDNELTNIFSKKSSLRNEKCAITAHKKNLRKPSSGVTEEGQVLK